MTKKLPKTCLKADEHEPAVWSGSKGGQQPPGLC